MLEHRCRLTRVCPRLAEAESDNDGDLMAILVDLRELVPLYTSVPDEAESLDSLAMYGIVEKAQGWRTRRIWLDKFEMSD